MSPAPHDHDARRPRLPRKTQLMSLTRWLSVLVVLSSLVAALTMFVIGASNTVADAPRWLKVENISSLKKTLMEVVAVLLAIMFVRVLAEKVLTDNLHWELLTIPLSIAAIAVSNRLMFSERSVSSALK